MSGAGEKLPPLVRLEDYDGNWERYIDAVFAEFYRDFIETQPKYNDKWVRCRRDRRYKGKEIGFWHCTSEGPSEDDRTPDFRRCERIRWIRFALEHIGEAGIDCWTNTRKKAIRHLVWLQEEFLIVLEERRRRDGFMYYELWTAYCTPEEHRKEKLRRERDQSRNS
jgi:hypothetical protein